MHYCVRRLFGKKVIGIPFGINRQSEALEGLETELCWFPVECVLILAGGC